MADSLLDDQITGNIDFEDESEYKPGQFHTLLCMGLLYS